MHLAGYLRLYYCEFASGGLARPVEDSDIVVRRSCYWIPGCAKGSILFSIDAEIFVDDSLVKLEAVFSHRCLMLCCSLAACIAIF